VADGPRERLVASAIELVRERGVDATGVAELLDHSQTARGSIYKHFPGGKSELVTASTKEAGEQMRLGLRQLAEAGDVAALIVLRVTSVTSARTSVSDHSGSIISR
jgi:TetR/AcrR family transcriptional regulator, lmrAB and yxaGH operons repressor